MAKRHGSIVSCLISVWVPASPTRGWDRKFELEGNHKIYVSVFPLYLFRLFLWSWSGGYMQDLIPGGTCRDNRQRRLGKSVSSWFQAWNWNQSWNTRCIFFHDWFLAHNWNQFHENQKYFVINWTWFELTPFRMDIAEKRRTSLLKDFLKHWNDIWKPLAHIEGLPKIIIGSL